MAEEFSTERQVLPECERALLLVDFINPLNFEGGQALAPGALLATRCAGVLRAQLASKPRHSAFYGTPLDLLLQQMRVRELIVTGLASDICVQMTAADAYLRAYPIWVPSDCCAAENEASHLRALAYMQDVLKCRTEAAANSVPTS